MKEEVYYCDRCGSLYRAKEYTQVKVKPKTITLYETALSISYRKDNNSDARSTERFDLCPGCAKFIADVLHGKFYEMNYRRHVIAEEKSKIGVLKNEYAV